MEQTVKLSDGREIKVRDAKMADLDAAEEASWRPHPTMPAVMTIPSLYERELVKRLTGLTDTQIKDMMPDDYGRIAKATTLASLPENRREAVKSFLEKRSEGSEQESKSSSNSPATRPI